MPSGCLLARLTCTFDLPIARRGPKTKRQRSLAVVYPNVLQSPPESSVRASEHGSVAHHPFSSVSDTVPLDTWDSTLSVLDPNLSPATVHTTQSSVSNPASSRVTSALQRWHDLEQDLSIQAPSTSLEQTVNRCFELFFEYLYPLTPLVHEPSLRDGLAFFATQGRISSSDGLIYGLRSLKYPDIWPDFTFTLVTAVCAEAAFLLPKDIFPEGERVADPFLQASRNCLNTYLEADLEYPNANSVAIRYFHSNCMHAAGKPRLSWHIFGEATRLAQVMQMHEEESLQGLTALEAEFRRRAFWIAYIGDKSAAILNNRPITIHKYSFDSGITIGYPTGVEDEAVLTPGNTVTDDENTRRSFIAGFNANIRLWQSASDLILEMRLLGTNNQNGHPSPRQPPTPEEIHRLDHLYVLFATSLDDLPRYLQYDQLMTESNADNQGLSRLTRLRTIQATNVFVSLHCLKMVITQKFEDIGYYHPAQVKNEILLLKKTDIARDLLRVIRDAPFWALQVNGEPCVEKIRLIGACLLEIIDQHEASPLSARARNDLSVLLDILTRLDSKASDTLRRLL
ncbi:transcriptional regulator family: Fungal Specific TF [Penicillium brevicompactum]|uniref:transcriptional regulator family: Fungal Specific TF n=1 Tax=Penicillium brevicompactum TaxID=5074 RepID=UPI002541C1CF|nr:transcriptional regulator family: Fungal Specific TF [Penicillium brevicompactum]KAJ5325514.1 transcriptional regulator family: Fungal Specific TF [Penicillium brevicompactum]